MLSILTILDGSALYAWCGVVSCATWFVDGFPTLRPFNSPPPPLNVPVLSCHLRFFFSSCVLQLLHVLVVPWFSIRLCVGTSASSYQLTLLEVLKGCSPSSSPASRRSTLRCSCIPPSLINMNRVSCNPHIVLELQHAGTTCSPPADDA
jgi:hypothetical protein